jgi:antitoxin VapB
MPQHVFATRQFQAGNSQAVRLPADIAFAPRTELRVWREGQRVIVEPLAKNLTDLPACFAELGAQWKGEQRPEWTDAERSWD